MGWAMADGVKRPVSVSVVAVLVLLAGALDIISAVILMLQLDNAGVDAAFGGRTGATTAAIGSIVVGAILVILALGLWRGSWVARIIVTVLEVLSLIGSLFLAVAYLGTPVGEWLGLVASAVILILLWTHQASAFFYKPDAR